MIHEELIPADHLLCKLAAAVDLSFVSETLSDCYCPDNGRALVGPADTIQRECCKTTHILSKKGIDVKEGILQPAAKPAN